jgi:hypothetical protein
MKSPMTRQPPVMTNLESARRIGQQKSADCRSHELPYFRISDFQVPHGVLFIYDHSEKIIVPEDTSSGQVLSTNNCISVWTVGEYDGKVEIILSSGEYQSSQKCIFSGKIANIGKMISINRSDASVICQIDAYEAESNVTIYANDFPYSKLIHCVVS